MSRELRKNLVLVVVALLVVAMVLASTGCTTTSGAAGGDGTLTDQTYSAAMNEICGVTASELDALPDPPAQISRVDWASEVARVLGNEANRFDALSVEVDLREPHGSLIRTAREQAAQFALLGDNLGASGADSDGIESISNEIRALSLGREELAVELGIPSCGTRALT